MNVYSPDPKDCGDTDDQAAGAHIERAKREANDRAAEQQTPE